MAVDKWMQGVHPKKGALHRQLRVPQGQNIPTSALHSAANSSNPLEAKRANLALRYRGLADGGVAEPDKDKKGVAIMIGLGPHMPPPLKRLDEMHKQDAEPDPEDQNEEAEGEDEGGVNPEWLDYTTDAERCHACEHMDDSGMCEILKQQVGPGDHCKAWEQRDDSESDAGPDGEGALPADNFHASQISSAER